MTDLTEDNYIKALGKLACLYTTTLDKLESTEKELKELRIQHEELIKVHNECDC